MYVALFASFNAKLNKNVLGNVSRSHAIDGSKYSLYDCRFVHAFGFLESQSLKGRGGLNRTPGPRHAVKM